MFSRPLVAFASLWILCIQHHLWNLMQKLFQYSSGNYNTSEIMCSIFYSSSPNLEDAFYNELLPLEMENS